MTTQTAERRHAPQLDLPGQSHVAEGPYDQTGMYVMHHAFRRDLARFVAAVGRTPVDAAEVWTALAERWKRFEDALHHHHVVEDEAIWPVLLRHADAAGDACARATLEAMEAEHDLIDPALDACAEGFRRMTLLPSEPVRATLHREMAALQAGLAEHLRHEETEALPLLQRTMTPEEWAAAEAAASRAYPAKMVPFLVPWVLDRLPQEGRDRIIAEAGAAYALIHRLFRDRYAKRDAVAFRHVPAVLR